MNETPRLWNALTVNPEGRIVALQTLAPVPHDHLIITLPSEVTCDLKTGDKVPEFWLQQAAGTALIFPAQVTLIASTEIKPGLPVYVTDDGRVAQDIQRFKQEQKERLGQFEAQLRTGGPDVAPVEAEQHPAQSEVTLTQSEYREMLGLIRELTDQGCYTDQDGQVDSNAIGVYAEALNFLDEKGMFKIEREFGRRVLGRWVDE